MRRVIHRRIDQLAQQVPPGCAACRDWPHVWLLNEGDPEPPDGCDQCGRVRTGLVRVYLIGVDLANI